ncbi:MAG: hypothetical protein JXR91_16880 [Deltaproteobacteria bacterium]|nr:hypothetical protein [Deltaproteobacteria bacterium]
MKKITLLTLLVSAALFSLLIAGCSSTSDDSKAPDVNDSSNTGSTDEESQFLVCDNVGDCWDQCYGCAITAEDDPNNSEGKEGACYEVYSACQGDETCKTINDCIALCEGTDAEWLACHDTCMDASGGDSTPSAEKYYAIDTCILCEACPMDCAAEGAVSPGDCEAK